MTRFWTAVRLALVLAVTVACLGWVLWGMDLGRSWSALLAYRVHYLVPVCGIFATTLVMRTWRFMDLLEQRVPFRSMIGIVAVSFLAINTMPLRMGELVRPYMLAEKHAVPFGSGVAAVVLERLLDLFAMLVLLGCVAVFVDLPEGGPTLAGVELLPAGLRVLGTSAFVGLVIAVTIGIVGRWGVDLIVSVAARVSERLAERLGELGYRFVDGLRTLAARPMRGARAILHTAGIWSLTLVAVGITMAGFSDLAPTVARVLLNWGATMTAMALFPTPGFFGPFEAASTASLTLLEVDRVTAGLFALVMHGVMFGFTALSGGGFAILEGWSLVGVVRASRATPPG